MRPPRLVLLLLFVLPALAWADDRALLRQVTGAWLDERGRWAFTQQVREYDGDRIKQERLERYDPSRGYVNRWQLVSIDGRAPTEKELVDFQKRKNKKPRRGRPEAAENFDFANAKVVESTKDFVRYELPLRSTVDWLFPISKVELLLTIDRKGPALKQVQARISEPFRVALGIARILDVDLDLQMEPPPKVDPADAKPSGTANVSVTKFGDRVDYAWSDFRRVIESSEKVPAPSAE